MCIRDRLKDVRVFGKAKVPHGVPHGGDHQGRREVGVGCRGAGGFVLLVGQQILKLFGNLLPFRGGMPVENARQCAPTGVAREDGLLVARGVAVFPFEFL